jgi:hypothetical protein
MLAIEPWRVTADPADTEMYAVAGAYAVAGNLPIEDANLIAAAPDMEEAITMLLRDIAEYERINNLSPSPGKADAWQSVTCAKAALAKARGEVVR